MTRTYTETFDDGSNGWLLWLAGGGGPLPSMVRNGALISRSPWGVDINHASPGAGYLHLLFVLMTARADKFPYAKYEPFCGQNRFVSDDFPTDFTNARITTRLNGDVNLRGAGLMLTIQTDVPTDAGVVRTNWILSGQPIPITRRYREHTITVTPDPAQWTYLGVRARGADHDAYGFAPIDRALRDININLILSLFPLDVQPLGAIAGDKDELRAGKDYAVNRLLLPDGDVSLDTVTIQWD